MVNLIGCFVSRIWALGGEFYDNCDLFDISIRSEQKQVFHIMAGGMDLNRMSESKFLLVEMNLSATYFWLTFLPALTTIHCVQLASSKEKSMTLRNTVTEHDFFFIHYLLISSPVKDSG